MVRKYRHRGYQDNDGDRSPRRRSSRRSFREGPRSPRMTGFREVLRCAMCGKTLPPNLTEIDFASRCPSCDAALHTCKNCAYFDPGSRFECSQVIPKRIPSKDTGNDCGYFEAKTTVEKSVSSSGRARKPQDAREAFENLFKK